MTDTDIVKAGRPTTCKALDVGELTVCYRCGLEWEISDPAPPACNPMTFARMRERLLAEISSAEVSLAIVTGLKAKGSPADPRPARSRLAEIEAVLRLFDRAVESKEIRDLLNGKK